MHKQEFYSRLQAAFQPEDIEDLTGLWEHLSEQIDSMDQQDITLAKIIAALGTPEDIAREYYLDLNIQTAISAESSVIPSERAGEINRLKKRLRMMNRIDRMCALILRFFCLFLWGVAAYFAVYTLRELLVEARLSPGALACFLAAGLCAYALLTRDKKRRAALLFVCGLGVVVVALPLLQYANMLYYHGRPVNREWSMAHVQSINIRGDIPYDITIQQGDTDAVNMRIEGKTTRAIERLIDNLEPDGSIDIDFNGSALFGLFTDTPALHLVLGIPAGAMPEDISIKAGEADVRMEGQGGNIDVDVASGLLVLNDTINADMRLALGSGDTIIQGQEGCTLAATGGTGSIIIKNNRDINIDIQSKECFIRLQDTNSESANVYNESGKTVVEDTVFDTSSIQSVSGDVVAIRQSGESSMYTESGSLVLKLLQGRLEVENGSGSTIVSQHVPLDAMVTTGSGLIRWEQKDGDAVQFNITGGNESNVNEYEDWSGAPEAVVELHSDGGAVKVFRESHLDD